MLELKHQSVRDLAWVVSSPPLISRQMHPCFWPEGKWFHQQLESTLSWLGRVDEDPSELDDLIATQKDRRLGKYFETLWFFWLSHNKRYDIIENNVQIIIDGETLGEIDFILFDKMTAQTVHWEVAVKFYLGMGNTNEMSSWYGPGLRDRLDIKVEHLCHRQSVISKNPRVSNWLDIQGIHIDQCAVILKGRLYYPWDYFRQGGQLNTTLAPVECAAEHLASGWLTPAQFDNEFDHDQRFIPLITQGWMEKISTPYDGELFSKKSIMEAVANKIMRLPLHVQLCNPHGSLDRVFLVSENWPDKNV